MREKDETSDPFVYVVHRTDDRSPRWACYVVMVDRRTQKITNCNGDSWTPNGFDDLKAWAYFAERRPLGWDRDRERPKDGQASYGWEVVYRDVWSVTARRAEVMHKTLRMIEKRMTETAEQIGRPGSFGEFLVHFALAIKAKGFVRCTENRGWNYSDSEHRFMTPAQARAYCEWFEADYLAKEWPQGESHEQNN